MANVTQPMRGRTIRNIMLGIDALNRAETWTDGVQLRKSVKDADAFVVAHFSTTQKAIHDAYRKVGSKEWGNYYVERVTNHDYKFLLKHPELERGERVEFTLTCHTHHHYPVKKNYEREPYSVHALSPELQEDALRLYQMLLFQTHRAKFVEKFVKDFIPKELTSKARKPTEYEYIPPEQRGRCTLKMIARDWPLLVRYFPTEYRDKLGRKSHSTKNQQLTDYEKLWIPTINEWLSTGLMIGLKDSLSTTRPSPKGIYLSL